MPHSSDVPFPAPTLLSLNGVQIELFEAGRENAGNPVVLCHGWPEHAFSWRHQIAPLVAAGHHVLVPNQRGYGNSSCPTEVTDYDIAHLTGDLVALLDHFGYADATFVGHDWGAFVVWGLALLHPTRVRRVAALSLPYQERGERPWIEAMETFLGDDFYMVHFNRQPGVADAILDANAGRFLQNLYRKNEPPTAPEPGMAMIQLAQAEHSRGEPLLTEEEMNVFLTAFEHTGFTPSIHWYRNLDRNWHLLAETDPIVRHPALMVYCARDPIQRSPRLKEFVPNVEVVTLDCGHWIQQERPEEVNAVLLEWLGGRGIVR